MTFRKNHHCQLLSPPRHPTSACPALLSASYTFYLPICFFTPLASRADKTSSKDSCQAKPITQVRCTWTSESGPQGSSPGLSSSCSQCFFSFSLRSLNPMIFPQVSDFQQPAPLSASFSAQFPHLSLSQPTMCSVFITPGNASLFACSSFSTSLLYWKDPEAVPSLPVLCPLLLSL